MIINRNILTLDEFTIQQMRQFPHATGELSTLLRDIGLAAKRVNVEVNKAGLVDILGDAGSVNIQGEDVKKLDIYANNQFMGVLKHGISCAGIGSEEMDDFVVFDDLILEVKSVKEVTNEHLSRTLNYMKLADTPIGIIVNFQNKSLTHKRLIST